VERHRVRAVRLGGRWIDIGSPDEYDRARREFGGREAKPVSPGNTR
jgi:NDP-sugar pyrophosphorylase family protein